MPEDLYAISESEAEAISTQSAAVFQPRAPINRRDFFAGRWDQLTTIVDAVSQVGLHVVIYGERGVGKTSIANVLKPLLIAFEEPGTDDDGESERLIVKVNAHGDDTFSDLWLRALTEVEIVDVAPRFGFSQADIQERKSLPAYLGLPHELSIDDVRRVLAKLPGSVFIFDEFDRIEKEQTKPFTDLIKCLSDYAIDSTVVIVGVSETVTDLIEDHASMVRSIIQVHMPRMNPKELNDILEKAEAALNVKFNSIAAARIVQISQGLPHYTHLVGQNSVRSACADRTRLISPEHVNTGCMKAVNHAHQSVRTGYQNATHSSHPDALYGQVLLACAIAAFTAQDDQGYFQAVHVVQPLSTILGREVQISTFNKHLTEFSDDEKRGLVLERKGQQRSYRYRFRDPLMPPFVIMKGVSTGAVSEETLGRLFSIKSQ